MISNQEAVCNEHEPILQSILFCRIGNHICNTMLSCKK